MVALGNTVLDVTPRKTGGHVKRLLYLCTATSVVLKGRHSSGSNSSSRGRSQEKQFCIGRRVYVQQKHQQASLVHVCRGRLAFSFSNCDPVVPVTGVVSSHVKRRRSILHFVEVLPRRRGTRRQCLAGFRQGSCQFNSVLWTMIRSKRHPTACHAVTYCLAPVGSSSAGAAEDEFCF